MIASIRKDQYPDEMILKMCKWAHERFGEVILVIADETLWVNDLLSRNGGWTGDISIFETDAYKRISKLRKEGFKRRRELRALFRKNNLPVRVFQWRRVAKLLFRYSNLAHLYAGLEIGLNADFHCNLSLMILNDKRIVNTTHKRLLELLENNQDKEEKVLRVLANTSVLYPENRVRQRIASTKPLSNNICLFSYYYYWEQIRMTSHLVLSTFSNASFQVKFGPETEEIFDNVSRELIEKFKKNLRQKEDRNLTSVYLS